MDLMRKAKSRNAPRRLKTNAVVVNRRADIEEARAQLPVVREEYRVLEAIQEHDVVIVCGETGSGKTTQLPQFLYEAGYCTRTHQGRAMQIGVTEPRRIAAMSVSKRVAEELNLSTRQVSYQIRYENTVTRETKIKFMTDGVLQKEIENDFALRSYSAIIIDEAHERSMHTDILIGLLSRIVPLRRSMHDKDKKEGKSDEDCTPPLKLVIMSATLRVEDFTSNERLFPNRQLPVINIEARQFPVTLHFSKRTLVDKDPVAAAIKKVSQIHRRLPAGGILVFMTGQSEILDVCKRLKEKFGLKKQQHKRGSHHGERRQTTTNNVSYSDEDPDFAALDESLGLVAPAEFEAVLPGDEDYDDEDGNDGSDDDEMNMFDGLDHHDDGEVAPLHVLPLYSSLAAKHQAKVFEEPPEGHRLCVVATNVAETSLTIPNMRYVVDTGLVKDLSFDPVTGVNQFVVGWTSKASAAQRAGRAGRTGPGHCYRLYSSAVFQHDFEQFSAPEITRLPADGLMLQMKAMGIDKVLQFPFPTPPTQMSLQRAEKLLKQLNALDQDSRITGLGKSMAKLPVSPRFGKMLALARHYNVYDIVAAVVAAMTAKNVIQHNSSALAALADDPDLDRDGATKPKHATVQALQGWKVQGIKGGGDLATLISVVGACDYELSQDRGLEEFCERLCLRHKAVTEINKLRAQLTNQGESIWGEAGLEEFLPSKGHVPPLKPPTEEQHETIRQIVLAAFPDHVARLDVANVTPDLPMAPYVCTEVPETVFIHPSSAFQGQQPEYIVFTSLTRSVKRTYMTGVSVIHREWLPRLAPQLCDFGKPLEQPEPGYDVERDDVRCHVRGTFGPHRWPLPAADVTYPQSPERYKLFAQALLQGAVFALLKEFVPHLKNNPNIVMKPWTKDRVIALVQPLIDDNVDCKRKLVAKLGNNPHYLMKAYALWLPPQHHSSLVATWSQLTS
eukprot:TRINITY_DN11227_c0_g1_i1.p1 TRINITY_DN11227_c0_g1~~TRINITY_DN11227_c0_g1_i1.p1  ORF type:complete len:1025 (+),score=270.17 TRINITY_DN11227_c0_g1_i1:211-3075(+)